MKYPNITAFLQNPWFPPGTRRETIDKYTTDAEFHRRVLARSMSGQRLVMAFGRDFYDRIHWDNVAPTAAEQSAGITDVDHEHVERVISETDPHLIITFGKIAEEALKGRLRAEIPHYACFHPNARGRTSAELSQFAIWVAEWVDNWRITS
jgi:hypothetical protein